MILENNPVAEADHSKVVITDDTIFAGGMNIGDEYSGGYHPKKGFNGEIKKDYWKDYMMKIEPGPASTLYRNQFFNQTRTPQEDVKRMALEWAKSAKRNPKDFSAVTLLHNKGGEITNKEKAAEEKQITYTAFYLMQNAKSEILIEHAYIQDQKVVDILKAAAARGVQVKLVRSMPESPDLEKINEKFFKQLKGVQNISIYQSNRVLHTKSLMVDGKFSIIGSANLSTASLSYHEEQSLYVQGASPLNKQVRAGIEDAIRRSRKVQ
jgi:phosphatidylserine/phosphatidylglycerophosphate/cardiolipin synthase-like enzyme